MKALSDYLVKQVLDGKNIGLDETTPLLEWGVINSIEMVRLLNFISQRFGVDIPAEKMVADHFANLDSIVNLVMDAIKATSPTQAETQANANY